mgnify:CR=1 FL=1
MFKVIKNPKTGKMETVEVVEKATKETLAEAHRELKDMLDGNRQFHNDPYTPPKEEPTKLDDDDDEDVYTFGIII